MFVLLEWFLHQKTICKFSFTWSKATIIVIKIWEFSDVLPNFPSHGKWYEAWLLLLINMVHTSCLMTCQTT